MSLQHNSLAAIKCTWHYLELVSVNGLLQNGSNSLPWPGCSIHRLLIRFALRIRLHSFCQEFLVLCRARDVAPEVAVLGQAGLEGCPLGVAFQGRCIQLDAALEGAACATRRLCNEVIQL